MSDEGNATRTPRRPGCLRSVWDGTRSLVLAMLLFLSVRTFLVEAFKIPTASMEETLLVGDFLLVNKAAYGAELPLLGMRFRGLKTPSRGDVVVFNPPHDPLKNYVKRVVGIPGDTLEMRDKILLVNGVERDEPYTHHGEGGGADTVHPVMRWQRNHVLANLSEGRRSQRRGYHPSRDNWGPLAIPQDRYFVLGDNRDKSEDSRYWGFVDKRAIRGQPWIVYFSFDAVESGRPSWVRSVRWDRLGERIH